MQLFLSFFDPIIDNHFDDCRMQSRPVLQQIGLKDGHQQHVYYFGVKLNRKDRGSVN